MSQTRSGCVGFREKRYTAVIKTARRFVFHHQHSEGPYCCCCCSFFSLFLFFCVSPSRLAGCNHNHTHLHTHTRVMYTPAAQPTLIAIKDSSQSRGGPDDRNNADMDGFSLASYEKKRRKRRRGQIQSYQCSYHQQRHDDDETVAMNADSRITVARRADVFAREVNDVEKGRGRLFSV